MERRFGRGPITPGMDLLTYYHYLVTKWDDPPSINPTEPLLTRKLHQSGDTAVVPTRKMLKDPLCCLTTGGKGGGLP